MVDILNSLSRLSRKLENRVRGGRHKPERTGVNLAGGRVGRPSASLPQSESRVVAGGDQDGEGNTRASTAGWRVRLRDQSPQPAIADGSNGNRQRREVGIDGEEVSSRGHSQKLIRLRREVDLPSPEGERVLIIFEDATVYTKSLTTNIRAKIKMYCARAECRRGIESEP